MHNVFKRVSNWNAQRYERKYNHALSISLLREEYKEWLEAKEEVDKLDALCDEVYVAFGVLWKSGAEESELNYSIMQAQTTLENLINCNELNPVFFIGTYLDVLEYDMSYPVVQSACNIIQAAVCQMMAMGLSFEQCEEAMLIVCDANDSKSVKKTDPSVKANAGDKGPNFISPEPRLQELLERRHATF